MEGECCGSGAVGSCSSGSCGSHKCKGTILFLLGVAFLLGTLGYVPEITLAKYWPVILIVWGLHKFCPCNKC